MTSLCISQLNDLDDIVTIDQEVLGNASRPDYIRKAIGEKRSISVKKDNHLVGLFTLSGLVENVDEGDPEIIYFKSK